MSKKEGLQRVHSDAEEQSWQLVIYSEQREQVPYWLRKVVGVQLRQVEAVWQVLQYFKVTLHCKQV